MMLALIASTEESACSNFVRCGLSSRKSATQLYAKSGSGNWAILFNRVLCRTVSNALEKSKAMTWTNGCSCRRSDRRWVRLMIADVDDPVGRKAN